MSDREELRKKAKATYCIFFGCLCLTGNGEVKNSQDPGRVLQDKLHKLFISEGLVTTVHKASESPKLSKQLIGEGISTTAPLRKPVEVFTLDTAVQMNLQYSSEVMGPMHYQRWKEKRKLKTTLLYDGFVYLFCIEKPTGKWFSFALKEQADNIHRWLFNLLGKVEDWQVMEVAPSPCEGFVTLYLLGEPAEELSEDFPHSPQYRTSSSLANPEFMYWPSGDEPLQESIDISLNFLEIFGMWERVKEFYLCQILFNEIESENSKAREIIGRVATETLNFYDINFLNIGARFHKSKGIAKDLACLYVLMPQIEKLGNDYGSFKGRLEASNPLFEETKIFSQMLQPLLYKRQVNIFTESVREMLRQDVSEIRAQINYQMLLLSAVATFLAIIITAAITLFG